MSAARKKKYEGDFCIQLYNSAVIKAKSGNCDIITLATSGTTRLKAGLAALDSAQPSNLEVEYVNLEDSPFILSKESAPSRVLFFLSKEKSFKV